MENQLIFETRHFELAFALVMRDVTEMNTPQQGEITLPPDSIREQIENYMRRKLLPFEKQIFEEEIKNDYQEISKQRQENHIKLRQSLHSLTPSEFINLLKNDLNNREFQVTRGWCFSLSEEFTQRADIPDDTLKELFTILHDRLDLGNRAKAIILASPSLSDPDFVDKLLLPKGVSLLSGRHPKDKAVQLQSTAHFVRYAGPGGETLNEELDNITISILRGKSGIYPDRLLGSQEKLDILEGMSKKMKRELSDIEKQEALSFLSQRNPFEKRKDTIPYLDERMDRGIRTLRARHRGFDFRNTNPARKKDSLRPSSEKITPENMSEAKIIATGSVPQLIDYVSKLQSKFDTQTPVRQFLRSVVETEGVNPKILEYMTQQNVLHRTVAASSPHLKDPALIKTLLNDSSKQVRELMQRQMDFRERKENYKPSQAVNNAYKQWMEFIEIEDKDGMFSSLLKEKFWDAYDKSGYSHVKKKFEPLNPKVELPFLIPRSKTGRSDLLDFIWDSKYFFELLSHSINAEDIQKIKNSHPKARTSSFFTHLIKNPTTPGPILIELLSDGNQKMQTDILNHPSLKDQSVLLEFANKCSAKNLREIANSRLEKEGFRPPLSKEKAEAVADLAANIVTIYPDEDKTVLAQKINKTLDAFEINFDPDFPKMLVEYYEKNQSIHHEKVLELYLMESPVREDASQPIQQTPIEEEEGTEYSYKRGRF